MDKERQRARILVERLKIPTPRGGYRVTYNVHGQRTRYRRYGDALAAAVERLRAHEAAGLEGLPIYLDC